MPISQVLDSVRRRVMHGSVHAFLSAAPHLSDAVLARFGGAVGLTAAATLPLRSRLRTNLTAALGPKGFAAGTVDNYLRRFGQIAEVQSRIFARSMANVDMTPFLTFGESIAHLDEAVQMGRGVVLCSPHVFGYDIGAGLINTRHRVVVMMRDATDPSRQAMKERWYGALGVGTVRRPRAASSLWDLQTCLAVLEDGAVLGITPDPVVAPHAGVPVRVFGRTAHVKPGIAALAMYSGAPLVTCFSRELEHGRREMFFTKPRLIARPAGGKRKTQTVEEAMREVMQSWFDEFQCYVQEHTAEWMFWLDKQWTRIIRWSPDEPRAAA